MAVDYEQRVDPHAVREARVGARTGRDGRRRLDALLVWKDENVRLPLEAMRTLYRLGGEMAHLATPFVASGENMSPPQRFSSDKLIREGDIVFIDIGAMWNGYYADIGRAVVCGRPTRRQQEVYTAVYHGLQAAVRAMRAGNTNDDVAAAVRHEGPNGASATTSCRSSSATGSAWGPTSRPTSARGPPRAPRRSSSGPA